MLTSNGWAGALALLAALTGCSTKERPSGTARDAGGATVRTQDASAPNVSSAPKLRALRTANGPRVYVTNEDSDDVSVIDVAEDRELTRIPVGKRPRGLRLSADQRQLYVAVSGTPKVARGPGGPSGKEKDREKEERPTPDRSADGIAVVDLESGRVVQRLDAGSDPESFDVSPDGERLYVSNEDDGRLSVLEVRSGKQLASIAVGGEPEGVAVRPDGAIVYVASEAENRIDVVDPVKARVIARIDAGLRPRALLFTPNGASAFATSELDGSLLVLDARAHKLRSRIAVDLPGARPMGLALSPDAQRLFVSTGRGGAIAVLDVPSGKLAGAVQSVGARPWGIALSSDGDKLYTANGPSNDVSVIDVKRGEVVRRIPVGRSPWGVVYARTRAPAPPARGDGGAASQGEPADAEPPGAAHASDAEASLRDILTRQDDERQWVMASKSYAQTRFSTMRDIRADNVHNLALAWRFRTGLLRGHEAAPLVVDGTMYLVTPYPNLLIALDLTKPSAPEKWRYQPEPAAYAQGVACCDTVNRGAAYGRGKIFYNTLDAHTVAVDAETGKQVWRTKLGDIDRGETMTMAPLFVRDRVFVGNSGGEYGVRGFLAALDADSGQIVWRAYSTGSDEDVRIGASYKPFYDAERGKDLGIKSWPPDRWQTGGGAVWGWVSYDPELDLIFHGTGNPSPWNPDQRQGDNKFTCGVFARRPSTGEAVWFYQWSPHDLYDHDGVNENIVTDLTIDGQKRKVLLHPGRTGYVYVLDRTNGQVLSATPFAHITTSKGVDLTSGRLLPIAWMATGSGRTVRGICPAAPGGKDWQPSAYVASSAMLYFPANNLCQDEQGVEASYIAGTPYLGAETRMVSGPGGHRGELLAWDVLNKRAAFRLKETFPIWSGVVATAGDLVFYGTMDGWFKAVHAKTGKTLWKYKTESGIIGQPITFRGPDGKQYVSVFDGVGGWAGAVVSGNLDSRDRGAALGFVGAMGDLKRATKPGGTLYTFRLP